MNESRSSVIRLLWPFTVGYRRQLWTGLALLVLAAAVEICSVLVMADVLDKVLSASSTADAVLGVSTWVAVTLLAAVLTYFGTMATTRASEGTVLNLRSEVFARLVRRPATAGRLPAGDLVVRLTEDVVVLETAISVSVVQAFIAALTTVGLVGIALYLSWQLTLIALIAVPILMGLSRAFTRPQERVTEAERIAHSDLGSTVGESVSVIDHAQLFNRERTEAESVIERGRALLGARIREARVQALFGGVLGSAQALTLIAVTVGGVVLVRTGNITYGTLIALTGYLGYLYPRIQDIAESRLALVGAGISADRLIEAVGPLDAMSDDPLARGVHIGPIAPATVEVADLAVRRSGTFELLCPDFRAEPGRVTVLAGPSGSGKSTLAAVLAGMLPPDRGAVTIAGHRLPGPSPAQIRDLVTLVSQPAVIRSGTVGENIAYGIDDAVVPDRRAIEWAGRAASVDEFVRALPAGYDTPIGYGGDEFSGGQRQRISLARGLVRRTPVLILDEPTTGLDRTNTARVIEAIGRIARSRTVIVISHDQRVIDAGDAVYRVHDGRVTAADGAARAR